MQPTGGIKLDVVGRPGNAVAATHTRNSTNPHAKSPWQRIVSVCRVALEIWRESRALERRLLGPSHYRRIGYD